MLKRLAPIVFALFMLGVQQASCQRAGTQAPLSGPQIAAAEQKLFKRVFSYDPMEKRLQRLELLLFGYSQQGSKGERWAQIQSALNSGHKRNLSLGKNSDQSPGGNQSATISAIEKQVLKKSSPSEPANKRLDRLESKVFGQASPDMAIDQRIERLERTIGMVSPTNPEITVVPDMDNPEASPFNFRFNGRTMPGLGEFGFGDPQVSQMLKEMDRQMREFERYGNTMPEQGPNGNNKEERHFFYYQWPPNGNQKPFGQLHPNNPPKAQPSIPGLKTPNFDQLPPYSDPNMI